VGNITHKTKQPTKPQKTIFLVVTGQQFQ